MQIKQPNRVQPWIAGLLAGVLVAGVGGSAPVRGDDKGPGHDQVVAIRNATVETMGAGGRLEAATLLIRGSRIVAVGTDVDIPPEARIIDGTGKTILPGFIDVYRVVSLDESGEEPEYRVVVVRGRTFRIPTRGRTSSGPFTKVADNYYPYGEKLDSWLRRGVTVANLVTRGQGQSAIIRLTPDEPEKMLQEPDGILYAAVTNETSSLDQVRSPLQALRGGRGGEGGRGGSGRGSLRGSGRGGPSGDPGGGTGGGGPSGARGGSSGRGAAGGSAQSLWAEVAQGQKNVLLNANNAATVLYLQQILKDHSRLKPHVILDGGQLYQVIDTVKEAGWSLVLAPNYDTVPYTQDYFCPARLAHEAGVPFVISPSLDSSGAALQDDPLLALAFLVKAGVPRQAALEAVTIRPARLLGLEKTHGSLEAEKVANFLIFSGDPLDRSGTLEQCWVEGKHVYSP